MRNSTITQMRKMLHICDTNEADRAIEQAKHGLNMMLQDRGWPTDVPLPELNSPTIGMTSITMHKSFFGWNNPLSYEQMLEMCDENSTVMSDGDIYNTINYHFVTRGVDVVAEITLYLPVPDEEKEALRLLGKVQTTYIEPRVVEEFACEA